MKDKKRKFNIVKIKHTWIDYLTSIAVLVALIIAISSLLIIKVSLDYIKEEQEPNLIITKARCPGDILNYYSMDEDLEIFNRGNIPIKYELIVTTNRMNCLRNAPLWMEKFFKKYEDDDKTFLEMLHIRNVTNKCIIGGWLFRENPLNPKPFFFASKDKLREIAQINITLNYKKGKETIIKNILSCDYTIIRYDDADLDFNDTWYILEK